MEIKDYFSILTDQLLQNQKILNKLLDIGITLSLIQERKIGYSPADFDLYEIAIEKYGEEAMRVFSANDFIQDLCLLRGEYIIVPFPNFDGFQKFPLNQIKNLSFLKEEKKDIFDYKGRVVKRIKDMWVGAKKTKGNFRSYKWIKENLPDIIKNSKEEVHLDIFFVDDPEEPRSFYGDLWFDFDGKEDSLQDVKKEVEDFSKFLQEQGAFHLVYFSGRRGFGILVPAYVIGVEYGVNYLPDIYKRLVKKIIEKYGREVKFIDFQLYHPFHLIRVLNSKHSKTGLRRIVFLPDEFPLFSVEDIIQMANDVREVDVPSNKIKRNQFLYSLFIEAQREVITEKKRLYDRFGDTEEISLEKDPFTGEVINPPCIRYILENGVGEGKRNESGFALGLWFKNVLKFKDEMTLKILTEWNQKNRPPLPDSEIRSIFLSVLKHPDLYPSCSSVLSNFCDRKNCYRFIRKDNLVKHISPELLGKRFVTDVYVVGTTGNTFAVPSKFHAVCTNSKCPNASGCPLYNNGVDIDISDNTKLLFLLHKKPLGEIKKVIANFFLKPKCRSPSELKPDIRDLSNFSVQELILIPRNSEDGIIPKGFVSPYIVKDEKNLYLLATSPAIAEGVIVSDEKEKRKVKFVIDKLKLEQKREKIPLTKDLLRDFSVMRVEKGQTIEQKINEILLDISSNITNIYERNNLLLAILLAYHSPLTLVINNKPLRGWVQVIVLGDTGTGKTKQFLWLQRATGLGGLIQGGSASRTGIAYSIYQSNRTGVFTVQWGQIVQRDTELLCIDEAQFLKGEDWGAIRSAREDGILKIHRATQTEAPARTRLIVIANPPFGKSMTELLYPVEYLKQIFAHPDIRRFDMGIFIRASTQEELEIIKKRRISPPVVPNIINPRLLRKSILWAWSLPPSDILIKDEVLEYIYKKTAEFTRNFISASDIPLASEYGETPNKVLRLATSLAILLKNIDEESGKVVVEKEHVDYILRFLFREYSSTASGYLSYASMMREKTQLNKEEIPELKSFILSSSRNKRLFQILRTTEARGEIFSPSYLASELGLEKQKAINRIIIPWIRKGLIVRGSERGKTGYKRTPKFIQLVSVLISDEGFIKELNNFDDQEGLFEED